MIASIVFLVILNISLLYYIFMFPQNPDVHVTHCDDMYNLKNPKLEQSEFIQTWKIINRAIPQTTKNILLILGKLLETNGKPSQELIDRIELAVETFNKYKKNKNNDHDMFLNNSIFLVSGGDQSNVAKHFQFNDKSEAYIMSQILYKEYNIPLENIYWENDAKETIENFFNVLKYIRMSNITHIDRLFVITSDYHMPRSLNIFNTLNTNPFTHGCDYVSHLNITKEYKRFYATFEDEWLTIKDKIYAIELATHVQVSSYIARKEWSYDYLYHMRSYLWTASLYNPPFDTNSNCM